MAARLARAKATIQRPTDELRGVSVLVRDNVATVRLGQEQIVVEPGVTQVEVLGRRSWRLHFEGGAEWTVTDERRKCCGGG